MKRNLALTGTLVFLFALSLVPPAAADPSFYEQTFLTDPAGDYDTETHGALDILGVQASEKFSYQLQTEVLQFRVELRQLSDIQLNVLPIPGTTEFEGHVTYEVGYTAAGVAKVVSASLHVRCNAQVPNPTTGDPPLECIDPYTEAPNYVLGSSLVIVVATQEAQLNAGEPLSGGWAASYVIANSGDLVYHDLAPRDNMHLPCGTDCELVGDGAYSMRGTYPFLTVRSVTPAIAYAMPGGDARFTIEFDAVLAEGADVVEFNFSMPVGWRIEPVFPSGTRIRETGTFTDVFRVFPPGTAAMGVASPLTVDARLSAAGGRIVTPLGLQVVPPVFEHPDYAFHLVQGAAPRAGQDTALIVSVSKDHVALLHEELVFLFYRDGRRVDERAAETQGDGTYLAHYAFAESGVWEVEVRLNPGAGAPNPHAVFTIQVTKKGGGVPTLEPMIAMMVVGFVALVRARGGSGS